MDISLSKLPWYAQVVAFVVLAAGGVGAFYYYYERDHRAEMAGRYQQLEAIRADVAKGQATAKKLPEFRSQVDDLEARLVSLREVLPEEKDAADLLRQMQTVAMQSSLTIRSFKPQPTATKQLHAEWPITLELDGTYHNLALFFDRIGKFERIVNISGLEVKGRAQPAPTSTITASCVATTFVLLDKPTAAKSEGKGGKGKPAGKPAAKPSAPGGKAT
jgi:type IV pilus assembly protein PilO